MADLNHVKHRSDCHSVRSFAKNICFDGCHFLSASILINLWEKGQGTGPDQKQISEWIKLYDWLFQFTWLLFPIRVHYFISKIYLWHRLHVTAVSMLAFFSDNPSSNPCEDYSFFLYIFVRNEQRGLAPLPDLRTAADFFQTIRVLKQAYQNKRWNFQLLDETLWIK